MEVADPHAPSRARAYGLAVASALCAGAGAVVGKIGVDGSPMANYLAWMFAIAVPAAGAWVWLAPAAGPRRCTRRGLGLLVAHALLAGLGCWGWYAGLQRLDPGVAAFVSRTEVLVTIGLGIALLGDRLRLLEVLGGALAIGGLLLMGLPHEGPGGSGGGDGGHAGFVYVLLGSLGFGAGEILAKLAVREVDPGTFTFGRSVLLAILWTAAAFLTGVAAIPSPTVLAAAAGVALLGPVIARALYMRALRVLAISRAALVAQLQPLCAALLGLALLGTFPSPLEWAGGLVLLLGCVLVLLGSRPPAPKA